MKKETEINFYFIDELYLGWVNEQDPFMQRKRKEDIKSKVSPHDLLMYSIRYALPFQVFRDIYPLSELFKALEEMEKRGEDITNILNKKLLIEGIEDIQALNNFAQKSTDTEISKFRLKCEGNDIFEFGDVKKIGKQFPYAYIDTDIESINRMNRQEKNYKGVPVIITIDNMGELPLEKLSDFEKKFDIIGVRIKDKDRKFYSNGATTGEYRPISLNDYKEARRVVDDEIINNLYVEENSSKMVQDTFLATQVIYLIANKIKYDEKKDEIRKKMPTDEYLRYYHSARSNITGLITGKAVCGGFSEILRNVLSCVDIKCKTMPGRTDDDKGHVWNQIELGNTWFNTDVTWAIENICEGKPSGDLFMSDEVFFGDRRYVTFNKGENRNGESMEFKAETGGHKRVFNNNSKKCDSCIPPYIPKFLIGIARKYAEEYEKYGKCSNDKGVVKYVGSSVEKMRSSSRLIETHTHDEP